MCYSNSASTNAPDLHEIDACGACHKEGEHEESLQWAMWGCEMCEEELYLKDYELWKSLMRSPH